jgi:hypothetical protein
VQGLVYVEGAVTQAVESAGALEATFELALARRATAATALNAQSSRSHLVCMLRMRRRDHITGAAVTAKLSFVDLAGSERVARSGALDCDRARFDEARAINKSLSALGDVIAALTSGALRVCVRFVNGALLGAPQRHRGTTRAPFPLPRRRIRGDMQERSLCRTAITN